MAEIHGAAIWPFEKLLEDLSGLLCITRKLGQPQETEQMSFSWLEM